MRKKQKTFSPTPSPLPATRIAQLADSLRYRFFDYVFVSLYTFIFSAPCIFWLVYAYYTFFVGVEINIYSYLITYGVLIPFIVVLGLGIGGGLYFFKKTFFGEGSDVHKDFFIGIKKNGKEFSLIFFILGLLYFGLHIGSALIDYSTSMNSYVKMICIGGLYALFIIFFAIFMMIQGQCLFYRASISQLVHNSIRFFIGDFLRAIGLTLLVLLPFLLFEFIPYMIAQGIVILICLLFYFAFADSACVLYFMHLFDRVINKTHYPEIYRKGLIKDESKDD